MNKFFKVFKLLFPFSNAFTLFIDKRFTQFIKGLSALPQNLKEYIQNIYLDLFPSTTRKLDKWNNVFGVGFPAKSEADQRTDLNAIWKSQGGQGANYIQEVLNNAGFDVQIHENNPPADPDLFLKTPPVMVAGGPSSYAGNDQAFAGKTGGDLLVNGSIVTNIPLYFSVCGATNMSCGNTEAKAGFFNAFGTKERIYQIPDDPNLWGAFFFIGGDATRDPVTHKLTVIDNFDIPIERKPEFIRLVLKLKPAQTWAGLMINYT